MKKSTSTKPLAITELQFNTLLNNSLASSKSLFPSQHPQLEKKLWKHKNDLICSLLYGCTIKELPRDLRHTVERVLNARHRQYKKDERVLLQVSIELSKRIKPSI